MEATKELKAAVYLRVSTKEQNEDTQLPDIMRQITADNAVLKDEYIFRDKISGLKDRSGRDGLNELLKLTKDDIDIVYIWEISRLSRSPLYFDELILLFKTKEINVCFIKPMLLYLFDKDTGEENVISKIALSMFSAFALFEITQKSQRTLRGKKEAINTRKESYSYKPPYGYKKNGKFLAINDTDIVSDIEGYRTEKEVIESIFKLYVSGNTLMQIKNILNEYNLKTRSNIFIKQDTVKINKTTTINKKDIKWGRRTIHNLLQNTVYCGYKDTHINIKKGKDENGKIIVETETRRIDTPAIITEELFIQAQKQMQNNKVVANKAYKNEFLLRGLLKCGKCGGMYLGSGSKGNNYYICSDKTHRRGNTFKGCKNGTIFTNKADKLIWGAVKTYYLQKMQSEMKATNKSEFEKEIENYKQTIEFKKANIKKLKEEQKQLIRQIGKLPDALADEATSTINKIEIEIIRIEKEIEALKEKIAISNSKILAIENIDENKITIQDIDDNYLLKKEALNGLLNTIQFFKHSREISIFQLEFKTGDKVNIIYSYKKNRCIRVSDEHYKFNTESIIFTIQTLSTTSTDDFLYKAEFGTSEYTPEMMLEENENIEENIQSTKNEIDVDFEI